MNTVQFSSAQRSAIHVDAPKCLFVYFWSENRNLENIFGVYFWAVTTLRVSWLSAKSLSKQILSFCFWPDSPQWARASAFTRFIDNTKQRITVGRTPLDEWSARRRDLYLTTHTTLTTDRQTASIGPGSPHSGGFWITHNDAPQSVGLLWTRDQLVAETSTWQYTTQQTDIHAPVWFEPTVSAS